MTTRTNLMLAVLIAIALSVVPRCSRADEWTSTDTAFQLTMTTLQIVDWGQTRYFLDRPYIGDESNPLLGSNPSRLKLNLMVGGAIVGHAVVSYLLPQPWRRVWQMVGIIAEAGAVGNNRMYIGANWSMPF